jgi:hypothetical protein
MPVEQVIDYYTGFEGEPEIRFIRQPANGEGEIVRLWAGYFDAIMATAEPGADGWRGLALPYHLDEGWYDESPWRIEGLSEVAAEWNRLNVSALDDQGQEIWGVVGRLLEAARDAGDPVWIAYD